MRRTRTAAAAALLAGLTVLTACGGGGGTSAGGSAEEEPATTSTSSASPSPAATTSPAAPSSTAAGATVALGQTPLGRVLVDARGMTLYLYDPDQQGASTCYDACAVAWPPLTTTGAPAPGQGVDAAQLGVVSRTDGSQQVTYHGWPLYLWQQDAAPGDTTGQGVKDVWWVVDASGTPIRG